MIMVCGTTPYIDAFLNPTGMIPDIIFHLNHNIETSIQASVNIIAYDHNIQSLNMDIYNNNGTDIFKNQIGNKHICFDTAKLFNMRVGDITLLNSESYLMGEIESVVNKGYAID